jgi:hypothetical protein
MPSSNPGAHSTAELQLSRWGVRIARKGAVLNCLSARDLGARLKGGPNDDEAEVALAGPAITVEEAAARSASPALAL